MREEMEQAFEGRLSLVDEKVKPDLRTIPQMLRIPGSKVKYFLFARKYFRYFMYSQYLGFVYCGILLVLAVFQDSVLRILPFSMYFAIRYSGILLYLKYFGVRYSGILSALEVFKDPALLILLSTRIISAFSNANAFNTRTISGFHTVRGSNTRSISGFYTARYCWLEYYSEYLTRMLKSFGV